MIAVWQQDGIDAGKFVIRLIRVNLEQPAGWQIKAPSRDRGGPHRVAIGMQIA